MVQSEERSSWCCCCKRPRPTTGDDNKKKALNEPLLRENDISVPGEVDVADDDDDHSSLDSMHEEESKNSVPLYWAHSKDTQEDEELSWAEKK
mmetsp:Transcript_49004/g.72834  ORF Transcript_49004/g.72834 Transcript_49004/m.72834 type:complete len:93 (-) Transcript_49004:201-479(-)